jgi:hypothetical protein
MRVRGSKAKPGEITASSQQTGCREAKYPLGSALASGIVCLTAEIFIPYHNTVGYVKFLTLVLFVYVAAAFTIEVPDLACPPALSC